jgi:hypothetical protein
MCELATNRVHLLTYLQNATTDANSTAAGDKSEPIRVEVQEDESVTKTEGAEDSAQAEDKAPAETDEEL